VEVTPGTPFNGAPTAFLAVPNQPVTNPQVASFDTNDEPGTYTATVDYGDGTGAQAATVNVSGTSGTVTGPTHTYAAAGTYTVTVVISTTAGTTQTVTESITAAGPPTASISSPANEQTYSLGEVVPTAFSCVEGTDGPGVASCVDSNGSTSGGGQLTTTTPGTYTYTVTATSSDGQTGMAAISYTVAGTGPIVSGLSPDQGHTAGRTAVTVTGTNFAAPATVSFGSAAATHVVVVNSTTITAASPAGTGSVDVTVTTPGGAASSPVLFAYLPKPTVTAVSPASGPLGGSTGVTITGAGFASPATVSFGSVAATNVDVVNATTITATSPAGTGTVNVTVTTAGGTSAASTADRFSFLAVPTVSKVTPALGPVGGDTTVTIKGTGFTVPAAVSFGGVAATNVVVENSTTITATSPATAGPGTVDVTVTTLGGTSVTSTSDQFTY
jgi:hypothetical protein